ncbi:TolA protein [Bradyrhizobium sp. NAS80.1]|uniref:cell envelope biogenesis protein TolA n=1 Tax=Bradyrhizobium sp. NAS80.1 TaxID=1680159 RepID=UPI00096639B8|nr:cell envelope biogenesis protein TolA [Bradyrhizobium sp. NAS80.1]OKO86118.1 TolA protein [Bradyrhizobium sp. NAS80.1]
MPKKLKTFQTSLGFYDLAIAAPSMKAALESWGAGSNLFHQGVARETDDPEVVAATMAKPGVVLKRPAGSNGRFAEHSELPSDLGVDEVRPRPAKKSSKPKRRPPPKIGEAEARQAALEFEKEQRRREAERRREEAARAKEREKREKAVAKAQAALDGARDEHDAKTRKIEAEREDLEQRARDEEVRWEKQKETLETALRRARES